MELRPGLWLRIESFSMLQVLTYLSARLAEELAQELKQKPGEKSVVQELIEERRAEKAKEDHVFQGP